MSGVSGNWPCTVVFECRMRVSCSFPISFLCLIKAQWQRQYIITTGSICFCPGLIVFVSDIVSRSYDECSTWDLTVRPILVFDKGICVTKSDLISGNQPANWSWWNEMSLENTDRNFIESDIINSIFTNSCNKIWIKFENHSTDGSAACL